jgi:hypothetical protein
VKTMKAHKLIGRASGSLRDMLLIHARLQFPSQCPAAAPFAPWAHVLAAIPSTSCTLFPARVHGGLLVRAARMAIIIPATE